MAVNSSSSSSDASVGLTDRISKLPDEISAHILGYLPVCDAVRTCVLSRRWRYNWTKAVQFNLYYDDHTEKTMTYERFFRLVLKVIISHVGPMNKCVLRPNWDESQDVADVEGDVNILLQLLSTKDIKDLTIDCNPDPAMWTFKLPPSIFQCLGISHLSLGFCKVEYCTVFKGFSNLVRLDLSHVEVNEYMLENVVLNCPLEMLFIDSCLLYSRGSEFRLCNQALSDPSLRVLDVVSYDGLHDCYLKYTSNLRVGSFVMEDDYNGDPDISDCFLVLRGMPKIEVLTYGCRRHRWHLMSDSGIIHKKVPVLLGNLKTLNLCQMDAFSADHISFMFCIIRSSPNLEVLKIHMDDNDMCETPVDEYSLRAVTAYLELEAEEEIRTSITTVTVTFERFHQAERIGAEIALIDSIVSGCPALRNLVIEGSKFIKGSAMLVLSKAIERFGQASSNLNIVYSNAH